VCKKYHDTNKKVSKCWSTTRHAAVVRSPKEFFTEVQLASRQQVQDGYESTVLYCSSVATSTHLTLPTPNQNNLSSELRFQTFLQLPTPHTDTPVCGSARQTSSTLSLLLLVLALILLPRKDPRDNCEQLFTLSCFLPTLVAELAPGCTWCWYHHAHSRSRADAQISFIPVNPLS
jgi:hypothetical protein